MTPSSNISIRTQYLSQQFGKPLPGFSAALSLPLLIQRGLVDNDVLTSYLVHAQPQDLMHALHHTWGGPAVPSISPFIEQVASVRMATIGADHSPEDGNLFKGQVSEHILQYAGFSIKASFSSLTMNGMKYESVDIAVFARANLAAHAALDSAVALHAARQHFLAGVPSNLEHTSSNMFDQALCDNAEDYFPARAWELRPVAVPIEFAVHNSVEESRHHHIISKQLPFEEKPSRIIRPEADLGLLMRATERYSPTPPTIAAQGSLAPSSASINFEPVILALPRVELALKPRNNAAHTAKEKIASAAGRAADAAAKNANIVKSRIASAAHQAKLEVFSQAFTVKHRAKSALAKAGAAAEFVRAGIESAGSKVAHAARAVAGNAAGFASTLGGATVTVAALVGTGVAKAASFVWNGVRSVLRGFQRI